MANELEDQSELSDDDASHSESSDDYVKSQARIKRKVDNYVLEVYHLNNYNSNHICNIYLQHFPRKSYQEQSIRPYRYCLCFYKTQTLLISGI